MLGVVGLQRGDPDRPDRRPWTTRLAWPFAQPADARGARLPLERRRDQLAAYAAPLRGIHFHEDDLYDCGWETDFSVEIPTGMASGVYGIRLRCDDIEDI